MAKRFTIMTRETGDTVEDIKVDTKADLAAANARFKELTGTGFLAYIPDGKGGGEVVKDFDKDAEETIFRPRLIGG